MLSTAILCVLSFAIVERASDETPGIGGEEARVLILGDSISIAYTPHVRALLEGEARVVRPTHPNGRATNCEGTTLGIAHVERWLEIEGGEWDVIVFNFGLHDIKRVHPETRKNSNDPAHPRQAEPEAYERQLREITEHLGRTHATLLFATTTPVPSGGVRPHRDVEDPARYNDIAKGIAREYGVGIIDLHNFAADRLATTQKPLDVPLHS